MALPLVLILGDGLTFGLRCVILVARVSFSNQGFHVCNYLWLPKTARRPWETDGETLAVADGCIAQSFRIKAHVGDDAPVFIRGERPSAQPRSVEPQDVAKRGGRRRWSENFLDLAYFMRHLVLALRQYLGTDVLEQAFQAVHIEVHARETKSRLELK